MPILDEYLQYLDDPSKPVSEQFMTAMKTAAGEGWTQGWKWGLKFIPATILAWKAANTLFSQATRKCGGIRKSTPGFKVCVSREKIKALNKKLELCNQLLSGCSGAPDPDLCKQRWQIQKDKTINRLQIEKGKISSILGGVTEGLSEQFLTTVAGFATTIAVGMLVDKLIFMAQRAAHAAISQAARKCGVFEDSPQRNLCMAKAKLVIEDNKARKLMGFVSKCNQEKNPLKCKEKLRRHIDKANREIQIAKDNITAYKNEIELKEREEKFKEMMKLKQKAGIKD